MRARPERLDGRLDRPVLGTPAQPQHPADRLHGALHGSLAVLGIEQRACRRLLHGQCEQVDHVGNVHVRPDVEAAADVAADTCGHGLLDQLGDLHAARRHADAGPVDQAGADDDRAHAVQRRLEHLPVDGPARCLLGHRHHGRVLMENRVPGLAFVVGADDAGAAGLDEDLACTAQARQNCMHDEWVI